jgi:hypothetical protein
MAVIGSIIGAISSTFTQSCNCMGPRNGEPKCPCMMRNVIQRDGRWIQKEVDLGPIRPVPQTWVMRPDGRPTAVSADGE